MENAENTRWVIIEVLEVEGTNQLFFSPDILKLPHGFAGNVIWYVFTPGWELSPANAVVFPAKSGFQGSVPQLDPTRPKCWNAAAFNEEPGIFSYEVTVQRDDARITIARVDPVVENEPPPGQPLSLSSALHAAASPPSHS